MATRDSSPGTGAAPPRVPGGQWAQGWAELKQEVALPPRQPSSGNRSDPPWQGTDRHPSTVTGLRQESHSPHGGQWAEQTGVSLLPPGPAAGGGSPQTPLGLTHTPSHRTPPPAARFQALGRGVSRLHPRGLWSLRPGFRGGRLRGGAVSLPHAPQSRRSSVATPRPLQARRSVCLGFDSGFSFL